MQAPERDAAATGAITVLQWASPLPAGVSSPYQERNSVTRISDKTTGRHLAYPEIDAQYPFSLTCWTLESLYQDSGGQEVYLFGPGVVKGASGDHVDGSSGSQPQPGEKHPRVGLKDSHRGPLWVQCFLFQDTPSSSRVPGLAGQ